MKRKYILIIFCVFNIFFLNADSLRILWWNVENLFDTTDDPNKKDKVLTVEQYAVKLANVSKILKEIQADVVGLAEVENILILKELAKKSGYPYYYLIEGNDPRGIDVCLLCKWEVEYSSHKNRPTPYKENKKYKFSRDCPEISFDFNGEKIYILLNHLKSKIGNKEKTLKKRIAQTKGILDIISLIYKKNRTTPYVIIMGDFNCQRFSEPLNILQKSGLKIINYFYKENKVYTTEYNNKKMDIDFFIINNPLFKRIKIKNLKSYNNNEFENTSDHFPLYLEIDI